MNRRALLKIYILVWLAGVTGLGVLLNTDVNAVESTTEAPESTTVADTSTEQTSEELGIVLDKPQLTVVRKTYSSVTLEWKRIKNAQRYVIFRKDSKKGTYQKIATTTKTKYKNKKLKATHNYYYRVAAAVTMPSGREYVSKQSKTKKARTKAVIRRTAYVGDSVMTGIVPYAGVKGKGRKVIAKIGISPWNFWRGTIMDDLLNYNPDRIYIMLGMNSLVGNPSEAHLDGIISDYKKIINECKSQNKDVEIVVLAISPTSSGATVKNSAIVSYNKKLKKMAKKKKIYYYDYTKEMKDAGGYLKREYNGGDGIHWTAATYQMFKKRLDAYGKKLDKN